MPSAATTLPKLLRIPARRTAGPGSCASACASASVAARLTSATPCATVRHRAWSRGYAPAGAQAGSPGEPAADGGATRGILDVVGRERPGEDEALPAVALLLLELAELLVLLDALGERLQAELLAELHERVQQRPRLGRVGDRRDERAVDLQDVDRELAQVRERRVAGAEVVDRDADAELLDRARAGARSVSASRMIAVSVISMTSADGVEPGRARARRGDRRRGGRRRAGGPRR